MSDFQPVARAAMLPRSERHAFFIIPFLLTLCSKRFLKRALATIIGYSFNFFEHMENIEHVQ
jgi:hypothetical protein